MRRNRKYSLLVTAVVIGAIMISPAGAHVGGTTRHLWNDHIKPLVTGLAYTKAKADDRFFRGSWHSYNRSPSDSFQSIGAPFSLNCKNDRAAIRYRASGSVRVVLDNGAGFVIAVQMSSGDTLDSPDMTSFGTQIQTWIAETGSAYRRYVVTLTRGVPNCKGTVELIRNPS